MRPSIQQRAILRATAAFDAIERYHGLLPKRLAILYDVKDLAALEEHGLLERVKIGFACGREEKGWRLTAAGRRFVPELAAVDGTAVLAPEHLRLLGDFYHYSRISRHRGMMPKKLAKDYDADDLRDLFEHGYLLRIRVKGRVTAKGWLVSRKGLRALDQAAPRRPDATGEPTAPARTGCPVDRETEQPA